MSARFWKVFELTISVLENMLLLGFCMDFMQQRPKGKRGKFLWLFAVLVGMIFPALEKYPAIYDRWELWLTLLWLFGYLAVSTRGSILRKIIAAVVARELTTFVNTAVLFGCSLLLQESVASFIQQQDIARIATVLLTKIIYVFLTIFLYLLKCPQSLILSALRAFCFCGKPHISRSIFLYFHYQAWLKSW